MTFKRDLLATGLMRRVCRLNGVACVLKCECVRVFVAVLQVCGCGDASFMSLDILVPTVGYFSTNNLYG